MGVYLRGGKEKKKRHVGQINQVKFLEERVHVGVSTQKRKENLSLLK